MKKMQYILKRLKTLNWQQMKEIANEVAKKTHKKKISVYVDILLSGLVFGAGYMDYFEFEFYNLTLKERKTYLTATMNNKIIAKYNNKEYMNIFSDKILFNETFRKHIHREFIDLRKATLKEFTTFLKGKDKIISKVIDSCGGKGITITTLKGEDEKKLFKKLKNKKEYLVEEVLTQHPKMAKLYPQSVNTLRVITFLKDNGEAEILNVVLRIGNGGEVDNFSSGGMYTFVGKDGLIEIPAIDEKGCIYEVHPLTKTKLVGYKIPKFKEAMDYVRKLALVEPHVRYVGWDIAITDKGIDLIEGNEYSGVFQKKPSLSKKKEGLLPLYKKYMDI